MAVGSFAQSKNTEINSNEIDAVASQLFYQWSKEDETLEVNNIAHPEKLK